MVGRILREQQASLAVRVSRHAVQRHTARFNDAVAIAVDFASDIGRTPAAVADGEQHDKTTNECVHFARLEWQHRYRRLFLHRTERNEAH